MVVEIRESTETGDYIFTYFWEDEKLGVDLICFMTFMTWGPGSDYFCGCDLYYCETYEITARVLSWFLLTLILFIWFYGLDYLMIWITFYPEAIYDPLITTGAYLATSGDYILIA